jgi:hypothetical protein
VCVGKMKNTQKQAGTRRTRNSQPHVSVISKQLQKLETKGTKPSQPR